MFMLLTNNNWSSYNAEKSKQLLKLNIWCHICFCNFSKTYL